MKDITEIKVSVEVAAGVTAILDKTGINRLPGLLHAGEQYNRLADYVIENRLFSGHDGSHTDSVIRRIKQLEEEVRNLAADKDQCGAVIDALALSWIKPSRESRGASTNSKHSTRPTTDSKRFEKTRHESSNLTKSN